MEFLIVFAISFLILVGVAIAFALGRPPTYRPTRSEIMQLLVDLMDKKLELARWEMFLSLPIHHDPELEQIRTECLLVAFGDEFEPAAKEGINGAIYDKEGLARIRIVAAKLNKLIQSEPASKLF